MLAKIGRDFDDDFRPLKPIVFQREKVINGIRNYEYLNLPSDFSPYRMRLPKLKVPIIKQRVLSFSEKLFPKKYNKKQVIYDNFSKMFVYNTYSMDKMIIINKRQCQIIIEDKIKRKESEKCIKINELRYKLFI